MIILIICTSITAFNIGVILSSDGLLSVSNRLVTGFQLVRILDTSCCGHLITGEHVSIHALQADRRWKALSIP